MRLSLSQRRSLTKTAIVTWLASPFNNDKRCCVKLVNDKEFDLLVEEVKKEAAEKQSLLFKEQ